MAWTTPATWVAGEVLEAAQLNEQLRDNMNALDTTRQGLVDAKGDLLGGTAADTLGRLAVGTDGQVLTAASGEATGLSWATPSSGYVTGELAAAQVTANTVGAGTVVTAAAVTFDGSTAIIVEFRASQTLTGMDFYLRDNGISTFMLGRQDSGTGPIALSFRLTPTAGSHAFGIYQTGGITQASTTDPAPAQIRVVKA